MQEVTPPVSTPIPMQAQEPVAQPESLGQIAAENFVAGASRALGTVVVYLLFLAVMFMIFSIFLWPRFEPYVNTYTEAMKSLQTLQQFNQPSQGVGQGTPVDSQQLQQLLDLYR